MMSASEFEEGSSPSAESEMPAKESSKDSYDVLNILQTTGHRTREYPNGIVLAVRTEGIPDTVGVHIDIVYVVDLRTARFGRGGLAMRSAVLETLRRSPEKALADVGIGSRMGEKQATLPWKKLSITTLQSESRSSWSVTYPTKTVYVIVEAARPTRDLSWLTDESRALTIEEFAIARRSDIRSQLPEIGNALHSGKWKHLEKGVERAWISFLSSIMTVLGIALSLLSSQSGQIPLTPVAVVILSGLLAVISAYSARQSVEDYERIRTVEENVFSKIGDNARLEKSSKANEDKLKLLIDLNFVVSPLMASAAEKLETRDIDSAVGIACSVIDECVRNSPDLESVDESNLLGSDSGLNKFLGLFSELAVEAELETLALAYVGLSQHAAEPIHANEAANHISSLNNALYDAGILRPEVKDRVDDLLNQWAMVEAVEYLDRELENHEEIVPLSDGADYTVEDEETSPLDVHERENVEFLGVMKEKQARSEGEDEMPVVYAYDYPSGADFAPEEGREVREAVAMNESGSPEGERKEP